IMVKENGEFQLNKDKEAVYSYFVDYVNKNTVFFHNLKEKMDYLIENDYYINFYDMYKFEEIKQVFELVYNKKFRFASFMSASKFYQSYALRDDSGEKFLERYEDRIAIVSLYLAQGDLSKAMEYAEMLINQEYQPATPTFLNSGKKRSGELVSCFLDEMGDNLSGIGYAFDSAMKLSSIGGGVSINLSKVRARGESIKGVEGRASGVLPIMKIMEDIFSYANQLGQRAGAGAVYLNVFHSDINEFLDCKKINVDEKIRIKSLSIGVIVPDKFMELAKEDEICYTFNPHTVFLEYGQYLDEMDMNEMYEKLVDNPNVKKKKINARELLIKISQTQKESGYPYLFFKDNANKEHALKEIGNVKFSNLCTEIMQLSEVSDINPYFEEDTIRRGISCNLGSLN
ncbi:MAG: ribonucleotide-diphosphate reductase subunit alpha, partial [Pseudoleptotrichia goodfellowii]|nr:ribonucleotide-diphosphate reductase subunit alpha [Pseudoleptotrichia goodfellowii]